MFHDPHNMNLTVKLLPDCPSLAAQRAISCQGSGSESSLSPEEGKAFLGWPLVSSGCRCPLEVLEPFSPSVQPAPYFSTRPSPTYESRTLDCCFQEGKAQNNITITYGRTACTPQSTATWLGQAATRACSDLHEGTASSSRVERKWAHSWRNSHCLPEEVILVANWHFTMPIFPASSPSSSPTTPWIPPKHQPHRALQ